MIAVSLLVAAQLSFAPGPLQQTRDTAVGVVPAQAPSRAKVAFDEIAAAHAADRARVDAASRAVYESAEYKAASEAKDRKAMDALTAGIQRTDNESFARRYLAAAEPFTGSPDQAQFFVQAFKLSQDRATLTTAIDNLLTHHLQHEALVGLSLDLARQAPAFGPEAFTALCERIISSGGPAELVGNAHYSRAMAMKRAAGRTPLTEEQQAAFDADMAGVVAVAPESIAAYRVEGPRFEQERLQIGMLAPNIVGQDIHGQAMNLEQFRGKVVVIDFWGDW